MAFDRAYIGHQRYITHANTDRAEHKRRSTREADSFSDESEEEEQQAWNSVYLSLTAT